jgi:hypothetical protein
LNKSPSPSQSKERNEGVPAFQEEVVKEQGAGGVASPTAADGKSGFVELVYRSLFDCHGDAGVATVLLPKFLRSFS